MAINLLLGVLSLNIVFAFGTNERLFCQKVDDAFVDTSTSCPDQAANQITGVKGDPGTPGLKGEKGLPGFVGSQNFENVVEEKLREANRELTERITKLEEFVTKMNTSTTDIADKVYCEDGFFRRGRCYFAIIHATDDVNPSAALKLCAAKGGIAANIISPEHEKLVADYIRPKRSRGIDLWLGMFFSPVTSTLRWSTGDAIPSDIAGAFRWFSSYPYTGDVMSEYVTITADSRDYGFRNVPSDNLYGVMCEK